jgi:hypothetical protein
MQTVTAEDIARRFPKVSTETVETPKKTKKSVDLEIPKFGE